MHTSHVTRFLLLWNDGELEDTLVWIVEWVCWPGTLTAMCKLMQSYPPIVPGVFYLNHSPGLHKARQRNKNLNFLCKYSQIIYQMKHLIKPHFYIILKVLEQNKLLCSSTSITETNEKFKRKGYFWYIPFIF